MPGLEAKLTYKLYFSKCLLALASMLTCIGSLGNCQEGDRVGFFFLNLLPRSICFRHSWKEAVGQDEPVVRPSMGVLHSPRAEVHVTFKGLEVKQLIPKNTEIHIWIKIWHRLWKSNWKTWSGTDKDIVDRHVQGAIKAREWWKFVNPKVQGLISKSRLTN